jgi:aspartate aminotransferase
MVRAFKERHDFVVRELNGMAGVSCLETDGTFYVLPNVQPVIERMGLADDVALSERLIEQAGVAVVPGSAFGCPGHVRLSIATSMSNLEKAMERLKKGLSQ